MAVKGCRERSLNIANAILPIYPEAILPEFSPLGMYPSFGVDFTNIGW